MNRKKQTHPNKKPWHAQPAESLFAILATRPEGLEYEEIKTRQVQFGFNTLPAVKKESILRRFFKHFDNILIYVLLMAAFITLLLHHWADATIILAVVIINSFIGFIQEGRAEKAMRAIRSLLSPTASVLRAQERQTVPAVDLVPGDVVILESGDKIPADLRLFKTHSLMIDESILTGESMPVEKQIQAVACSTPLAEQSSMAFSGTLVTNGQGRGVVVATGQNTEIGRISGLLFKIQMLTTPLLVQLGRFAKTLTVMILLLALLLLAYGYFFMNYSFTELFMVVVGLSVAAVPEGLPAVLSITLAIGVQAMAKRNVIIRRLPAIETLGSVSVICTDKTGTLTHNEMTVATILTSHHLYHVTGLGYKPVGAIYLKNTIIRQADLPLLSDMLRAAILCNDASLYEKAGNWKVEGDPTEGALLTLGNKGGLSILLERHDHIRLDTIAFDSHHRYMASLHQNPAGEKCVFVKGAPEQLLDMCRLQKQEDGSVQPLDVAYWHKELDQIAAKGQRVLALAMKPGKSDQTSITHADIENGLVLLGLCGIMDPPRDEAISAVAHCLKAGIQVKMITGDHASTAKAIARQIGLLSPNKVLTGSQLDKMSDAALANAVMQINVYARTNPEHKLKLVMALQAKDMIVAMTGDGVNDALALKRADAGIAMGKKGNDVSKEAAELILVDDNFASIVAAIQEGRTVYDNLKKVISWTLPTNAGEAMTVILALLLGLSMPVTPIQILWINLITAVTLGLALAFEPTEKTTMRRRPRPRTEPLLSGMLVWHIIFVSFLFICAVFSIYSYALDTGHSLKLARTIALNTVVVLEIFHLFYIRNIYGTSLTWEAVKGTKAVWICITIITVAQLLITYVPYLQAIFATESLPLVDGILIVLLGGVFFMILEAEKRLRLAIASKI